MKYCTKCGNALADDARFCDKCGNFAAAQSNPQPAQAPQQPVNQSYYSQPAQAPQQPVNQSYYSQPVQAPQQPVNQSYYSQPAQAPQQPHPAAQNPRRKPPKKKNNTAVIIAVVAAVAILLAIIGSCSQRKFQEQGYGQDSGNDYSSFEDNYVPEEEDNTPIFDMKSYTKGEVVNGTYVNEWADLSFDIGGDWVEGTESEYAAFGGDGKTECGLLINDQVNGLQMTIAYEKLGGADLLVDEDDYLDIVAQGMVDRFEGAGLSCDASEYYDYTVASDIYRAVQISFQDNPMVQQIYVRNYDGYMIFIMILAYDEYDAVATVDSIYAAN